MSREQDHAFLPRPCPDPSDQEPAAKKLKRDKVPVACDRCRIRKVKCSGARPTCDVCDWGKAECRYTPQVERQENEELKKLRQSHQQLCGLLKALVQESLDESMQLLHRLRAAKDMDEILSASPVTAPAVVPAPVRPASHHPTTLRLPGISELLNPPPQDVPQTPPTNHTPSRSRPEALPASKMLPISRWTRVSGDDEYLNNQFTLFWAWDNTLTRIIHRAIFFEELCNKAPPDPEDLYTTPSFCSSFLVNAVLAASSIFNFSESSPDDCRSRGRAFAEEAHRLLQIERLHPSLPLVQGLALLWVWEESVDNGLQASSLLRELYHVHNLMPIFHCRTIQWRTEGARRDNKAKQAIYLIAWGLYCLDVKISLVYGSSIKMTRPQLPRAFLADVSLGDGFEYMEDLWCPYSIANQPRIAFHQGRVNMECDFAEIAEASLRQIAKNRVSTAPDFALTRDLYHRLIVWRNSISSWFTEDHSHLPSAIFLELSIDMFAIKLLESFVSHPDLAFDQGQTALSLSLSHSRSIVSALWNYRTAYGMRHEFWMMQACWIAATALLPHLTQRSPHAETFRKSCELMCNIAKYIPVGSGFLLVLEAEISRRGADVPFSAWRAVTMKSGPPARVSIRNVMLFEGNVAHSVCIS